MNTTKCPDCQGIFSRKDVMLRHWRNKHSGVIQTYPPPPPPQGERTPPPPPQGERTPPPPPPPPQMERNSFKLKTEMPSETDFGKEIALFHPFTMMITGPTACGKTSFLKDLLRDHITRIRPQIQRIVWLYRRWQPLYTNIQHLLLPKVEFIQGIPADLDEDDFFDPNVNNLLILDDLMSLVGKDKRVTDLFTEGSHHRNLSVISISQNLYASKDPTQRRNCHYLVLFNNPVDQQSIMTLARQMYPGKTDLFIKTFNKATKYPYGYLLVDLKPFTQEDKRLNWNITWKRPTINHGHQIQLTNQEPGVQRESIKDECMPPLDHSFVRAQPVQVSEETTDNCCDQEDEMADKINSCDDCGLLFDTHHDDQRHVKRGWCAENTNEPPSLTVHI